MNYRVSAKINPSKYKHMHKFITGIIFLFTALSLSAQTASKPDPDELSGEYGRYRANNDLIYYHLDIRVDPDKKHIGGKTTIRFKMLKDDNRIQLELTQALNVDKIVMGATELKYERDKRAVFVDFPAMLKAGKTYDIDFYYSGNPPETGPLRRDHLQKRSGRASLGLYRVRGARSERLVAEQGPVARRGRIDGDQRRGAQ